MHTIFKNARIPLYIRPYEIIVNSPSSGIIECVPNTLSVDSLKKRMVISSLFDIFVQVFQEKFDEA